jgi:hypothetical protein
MIVTTLNGNNLDGAYERLLPAGALPVTNSGSGVAILVGSSDWGPRNTATLCGSLADFVSKFGTYGKDVAGNETSLYHQAWQYFTGGTKDGEITGGGAALYVIRIASTLAMQASYVLLDNAGTPGTVGTATASQAGVPGNNIALVVADGSVRLVAPTAAPVLTTAGTGGTIAAGTNLIKRTLLNNRGETTASPQTAIVTTGATSTITDTLPALPTGATGWNVYVSTDTGVTWKKANATPQAAGAYVITAPATGATFPTVNTAATSFTLTVIPFDNTSPEVYKDLTPATAATAITGISKWLLSWAAGASVLLPTPGTYFLAGGVSGLDVLDADYVGTAGAQSTGLELAATIKNSNYVWAAKFTTAIKAKVQAVAAALGITGGVGPVDETITYDVAGLEALSFNDSRMFYPFGHRLWLNPVSGIVQKVCPVGSIIGARCNAAFWSNTSQTKLLGFVGPAVLMTVAQENVLAGQGVIPVDENGLCLKGCNTSQNAATNQIEDIQIPLKLARDIDATCRPLVSRPILFNPATNTSPFYDDFKHALGEVGRQQPPEAISGYVVVAAYDPALAAQNQARGLFLATQTGKALQILVDIDANRTTYSRVPAGFQLQSTGV